MFKEYNDEINKHYEKMANELTEDERRAAPEIKREIDAEVSADLEKEIKSKISEESLEDADTRFEAESFDKIGIKEV